MRQALHILRKDIRYLWIEITVTLAAAGLLVITSTQESIWRNDVPVPVTALRPVAYLLALSWWVLIVRAVYAETLAGDREFWPTRPYAWPSLLAAKAMLIGLFVNLPLLAAQAVILHSKGFALSGEVSGLLWNQVLITVAFVLPAAVLAALTTGLVQFLMVVLVAFTALMLLSMRFLVFSRALVGEPWFGLEWTHVCYSLLIIAVGGMGILLWQYAQRRTVAGRAALGAMAAVLLMGAPFSWSSAFAIQTHFGNQAIAKADIRAGFADKFAWTTRALIERGHHVALHIPVHISGVAPDLMVKPEAAAFTIESRGSVIWRAKAESLVHVTSSGELIGLQATLDEALYQKIKDQPVVLHGDLYLTIYGNRRETRVPFTGRQMAVPGLGRCLASGGSGAPYFLACDASMRPRADMVSVHFEDQDENQSDTSRQELSYSPLPAELSLDPLNSSVWYSPFKERLDAVTVVVLEPVAWVRAPIVIEGLKLGAYEARLN